MHKTRVTQERILYASVSPRSGTGGTRTTGGTRERFRWYAGTFQVVRVSDVSNMLLIASERMSSEHANITQLLLRLF